MKTLKEKVMDWMATGEVGASSRAMAFYLSGLPCDGSYPLDPDDFNRCLKLLAAVPELRERLPQMAAVSKSWAALVERWDDIEATFINEAGLNWSKAQNAPKTFRLMSQVRFAGSTVPAMVGQDEPFAVMVNKLHGCRFAVGSGPKRFVRQLAYAVDAGLDLDATLTDRQKDWLRRLRHCYRKQIDAMSNRAR